MSGAAARETRPPAHLLRLVPFDEIQLSTERPYLVKGLIPREGLVVAWGPPKCGKSFWAFDLAMHFALGWTYRGRRVTPVQNDGQGKESGNNRFGHLSRPSVHQNAQRR